VGRAPGRCPGGSGADEAPGAPAPESVLGAMDNCADGYWESGDRTEGPSIRVCLELRDSCRGQVARRVKLSADPAKGLSESRAVPRG